MKKTFFTIALSTITLASSLACGYGGFGINCRNFGELNIRDYNETQEHIFYGEIIRVDANGATFNIVKVIKGEFETDSIYVQRPLFNPWNQGENLKEFKYGQEWLMFTSAERRGRRASMYECSRSSLKGTRKFKRDLAFFASIENTPNGHFRHFDSKGRVTGAGDFQNGLPQGTWRYYDEKGREVAIANYKDGLRHGTWTNFTPEGVAVQKTKYVHGEMAYQAYFNATGDKYSETIIDGTLTISRSFHANGKMSSENLREEDGSHVIYRSFFENGRLRREQTYINGHAAGLWRTWDESGKLIRSEDHRKKPDKKG